ncbi:hypothetical protein BDAP_001276 [Binucleata daphniae]
MSDTDVKSNTFTEEGRILQVEYAIKNISRAPPTIALKCTDGVVLIGFMAKSAEKKKSEDEIPEKINPKKKNGQKIFQIQEDIYVAVTGMFSDSLQLVSYARVKAEEFKEKFCCEMSLTNLVSTVGEIKHAFTLKSGMRPFGVSFLYAGTHNDDYCLMSSDPSGTINTWKGFCVGEHEDAVNSTFRTEIADKEMCMKEGTKCILRILGKVTECGEKEAERLEVLHFSKEKKHFLSVDEIKEYFE